MATIKLKSLITEADDFQARSKETGKLVHFKSKDAYQSALKAGTHEDPKAKKGGQSKADTKPNDMFGGDYAKDRGGESPKGKKVTNDDIESLASYKDFTKFFKANFDKFDEDDLEYIQDEMGALDYLESDYESGDVDKEELLVAYVELQDLFKRALSKEAPTASNDTGDDGFGWGPEIDRTPVTKLPKKASQLEWEHSTVIEKAINAEVGLDGYADTDDNSGAIRFSASKGDMPTYTLYFGSNEDYGKPDEFRVSLESTYGEDPAGIEGKVDKSFKSSDEAMKFVVAVAKKYKKELQMDDDTNESTKLTSIIKK